MFGGNYSIKFIRLNPVLLICDWTDEEKLVGTKNFEKTFTENGYKQI